MDALAEGLQFAQCREGGGLILVTIPVIDISPQNRPGVAAELGRACAGTGFVQITGHGVDLSLLDAVYTTIGQLAALEPVEKASLVSPTGHQFRGLVGAKDADGHTLVESLQVNVYDGPAEAQAAGVYGRYAGYFHPNVWPAIAGFRDAWLACSESTRRLGARLMGLFALAMGLPEDHFAPVLELDVTQFGINWYPPQPAVADPGQRILTRAHSDSGMLTILHQRGDYEGLQAMASDGSWTDVPVLADAFVINIGDLMHRWTNGRWPAVKHRVVSAPDPAHSRASIVTFYLPAVDTVIAPLPGMVGQEGPVFEPVMQYDWEAEYLADAGYAPGGRTREAQVAG